MTESREDALLSAKCSAEKTLMKLLDKKADIEVSIQDTQITLELIDRELAQIEEE